MIEIYIRHTKLEQVAASLRLVGTAGFEPATPCTPCKCATRLRYAPTQRKVDDTGNFKKMIVHLAHTS